jgi:mannose-6-phosphate isomerase-like protein (cupin superfamily)
MSRVKVSELAAALPAGWRSQLLAEVGTAAVKVLRMDGRPVGPEVHEDAEVLLVLDGRLELVVDGLAVPVARGEAYRVPAGVRHAVGPGSRGTLLLVEVPPAPADAGEPFAARP